MDVLAQALNVAEQAEEATGQVTLTFDLNDAAHRTAYAAALAVLRMSGVDEDALIVGAGERFVHVLPAVPPAARDNEPTVDPLASLEGDSEQNAQLLKDYAEALKSQTPDNARRATVARDTFARVAELIRDGANIEAVAQIQYRRWVEEHLDAVR